MMDKILNFSESKAYKRITSIWKYFVRNIFTNCANFSNSSKDSLKTTCSTLLEFCLQTVA